VRVIKNSGDTITDQPQGGCSKVYFVQGKGIPIHTPQVAGIIDQRLVYSDSSQKALPQMIVTIDKPCENSAICGMDAGHVSRGCKIRSYRFNLAIFYNYYY
jgi:hypothetical protein